MEAIGELGDSASVQAKMPKKLERRQPVMTENSPPRFEEISTTNRKILEAVDEWKKQKQQKDSGDDD